LEGREKLRHHRLSRNQQKSPIDEPPIVGTRLNVSAFERVGVNIEEFWDSQRNRRIAPNLQAVRTLF
jgi:hypothetical protein